MATEKKKSRWVDAITSMIELSQDGKIVWTVDTSAKTSYEKERTTSVFQTKYNDQALRLYQIRVPTNINSITSALVYQVQGIDPPKWFTKVILEFVDNEGRTLWAFPDVDALSDLLTSVQFQVAGVKGFLDTIIGEASGIPKRSLPVPEFDLLPSFKARGDALNAIIKIVDDASMSEAERLKKARAKAVSTLATPEF